MRAPERILLVRLSHLGDVVHALPVFHALSRAWPRAEIGWVVQPEFAELVRPLPGLARVLLFGRREGWRAWPRLRRELAAFGADRAIDAQGNLKSAAVTLCSRARRRVGLPRSQWREPLGSFVVDDPAPEVAGGVRRHALDRMLALARHATRDAGTELEPRFDPALTGAERRRGEEALDARLGAGADAPVLVSVPSPGDVRSWPLERVEALARGIAERGIRPLLLSGPAEEASGRALAERLGDRAAAHWVGQRGLRELAAVYDAAARRGGRIVTCDSGPLHLAVACGLPVLALAGPQDEARTGPWPLGAGSPHRVLRAGDPPRCAPCLARRCDHPRGPVCMEGIGADEVVEAVLASRAAPAARAPARARAR